MVEGKEEPDYLSTSLINVIHDEDSFVVWNVLSNYFKALEFYCNEKVSMNKRLKHLRKEEKDIKQLLGIS